LCKRTHFSLQLSQQRLLNSRLQLSSQSRTWISWPDSGQPELPAKSTSQIYRERYSTEGFLENYVYPGIEDALGEFHSTGVPLFVATSKPHAIGIRILDHFGLSKFFVGIYGSELDGTRSDKSELLRYLIALRAQTIYAPSACCGVTDRGMSYVVLVPTDVDSSWLGTASRPSQSGNTPN
jgi:phosphoglycolate phosphatase-like HAD superfamily hydrolase